MLKRILLTILLSLPSILFASLDIIKDGVIDNNIYYFDKISSWIGVISLIISPILLALYASFTELRANKIYLRRDYTHTKLNQYTLDYISKLFLLKPSDMNIRVFYVKKKKFFSSCDSDYLVMKTLNSYEEKSKMPNLRFKIASDSDYEGLVGKFYFSKKFMKYYKDLSKLTEEDKRVVDNPYLNQHTKSTKFIAFRRWEDENGRVLIFSFDSITPSRSKEFTSAKDKDFEGITFDYCTTFDYINSKL